MEVDTSSVVSRAPASLPRVTESQPLRRTSLFDEHVAAGARLVPFAGWEMPVQYEGVPPEHVAVRSAAACSTSPTWARSRTAGPGRWTSCSACCQQRRREARGRRRPVLVPLRRGRRHPRRPLHLPARRRPLPDRHQRRQPRDGPRLVRRCSRRVRRRGRRRRRPTTRCSPCRDPRPRGRGRARLGRAAGPDADARRSTSPAREALVCGTGYTGEDGVEILLAPTRRRRVWDELLAAGATPCGLGARDTLRLEVCFHLYGNDMDPRPQPDRGRPRLVLQGGRPGSSARRRSRAARAEGHRREARAFVIAGRGIPRAGQPGPRRRPSAVGVVTSGTLLAVAGRRDRDGLRALRAGRARDRASRSTSAASAAAARRSMSKPLYRRRGAQVADESYPDELGTTPSTTGPGSTATRRLRDHLVRPGRARRGRLLRPARGRRDDHQGRAYAEVESVKAVSDVIAPLSGEILEVNDAARRRAPS